MAAREWMRPDSDAMFCDECGKVRDAKNLRQHKGTGLHVCQWCRPDFTADATS